MLQTVIYIILKILIYSAIIACVALQPVVHHDELAVWNASYQLGRSCLRPVVKREMRTDHIEVIFVKTCVQVICKQFKILVVCEDGEVRLVPQFFCKRVEKHLLVDAQLVKKHQHAWLRGLAGLRHIESLALLRHQQSLLAKDSIGLLHCLL